MTRPEPTSATADEVSVADDVSPADELSPADGVTGADDSEPPEPSFSEQLAEQLGGWRGLVESSIPVTVFVLANVLWKLKPAIIIAVAAGLVIAAFRLTRRQPVRHAVNGLFGIVIGAVVAWRSGEERNFYLPGMILSAGYVVAMLVSVAVRWPIIGWLWSVVVDGGKTRWRTDRNLVRAFGWLTVLWAITYFVKLAIQVALYLAHQDTWLGIARLALGWPPYALLLAVTVWYVRRVTHDQTVE
jgi:hypothetical protein